MSAVWMVLCATLCLQLGTSGTFSLYNRVFSSASMFKAFFIWHTKVKAKSDQSVKTYIKADQNTITPFGVKVMSKYKELSWTCHDKKKKNLYLYMVWLVHFLWLVQPAVFCGYGHCNISDGLGSIKVSTTQTTINYYSHTYHMNMTISG